MRLVRMVKSPANVNAYAIDKRLFTRQNRPAGHTPKKIDGLGCHRNFGDVYLFIRKVKIVEFLPILKCVYAEYITIVSYRSI